MKDVLIKAVKRRKWYIISMIILIGVNLYLATYPAKLIGNAIDLMNDREKNTTEIINIILYLLIVSVVLLIVKLIWRKHENIIARSVEKDIKDSVFERFMKLKIYEIQNIKNGELMSYFVRDINDIRAATYRILSVGIRFFITFAIVTYSMIKNINLYLTIYTMIPLVLVCIILVLVRKKLEKSVRKATTDFTSLSEYIQEGTDSIRTTKAYSMEEAQIEEFITKNRKVKKANNDVDMYQNLINVIISTGFGICYAIAIWYGSKLVLENQITIGQFVSFNGYIELFVSPISWIPSIFMKTNAAKVAVLRLDRLFNLQKEDISLEKKNKGTELKGKIEFKDLSYNYPGYIEKVLEDINIEINQGETLGIIGRIGSGKTTLMNLLLKLYDVKDGKIFIDGKDINKIQNEVLRENICYITQENFLFSATIKENINLFKKGFEDDHIRESLKQAMIYDDVIEMPNEIDTIIGERGIDLSGGQKQRIEISRAFLNKSNIIIFDDTFSALDNRTEQRLLTNIKELTKGKTCIIVSNRISDVKICDKIIVLDDGKIAERGTHNSLIMQKGKYYNFYVQQAKNSIEEVN